MTHEPNERTAQDIRRDIAETREELGETVAALTEKADVKGQAKARVEEVKSDVREKVGAAKERIPGLSTSTSSNGDYPYPAPDPSEKPVVYRDPKVIGAALALGIATIWLMRRRR
jgi:Protein of unknown function (DUF3618)